MKKVIYFLSFLGVLGMQSCSNNEMEECSSDSALLQMTPTVEGSGSRAIIEAFKPKDELGWFFTENDAAEKYTTNTYKNNKYTLGEKGWAFEDGEQPLLTQTKGILYAYYPYASTSTDKTAIPMSNVFTSQTDYLYAKVADLNSKNSSAVLSMNHANSQIIVNIKNKNYNNTGVVSAVKVNSANIGASGTLNLTTNAVTTNDVSTDYTLTGGEQTIDDTTAKTWQSIFIPKLSSAAPTFTITLDGIDYTVSGSAFTPEQGKTHTYEIEATSTGLTISAVSINKWIAGQSGTGTLN